MAWCATSTGRSSGDAKVRLIRAEDPDALAVIRHDCAHVMAEAVQDLFPGTQVTIGPAIENGFYYDFFRNEPFSTEDLGADRGAHGRDREGRPAVRARGGVATRRATALRRHGRALQARAARRHPGGRAGHALPPGRLVRSVPRPARPVDRPDRRLQADQGCGLLLARRRQQRAAAADLRHGVRHQAGARRLSAPARGGGAARPSQARPRDGPVPRPGGGGGLGVLAPAWLDAVAGGRELCPPPARRRRLRRGQDAAALRPRVLGALGPLGEVPREHVHAGGRGAASRAQADELPRPRADLQPAAAQLPRPAAAAGRVRLLPPQRAVGCAARHHAGARLHPGRRAHLLHARADHGRERRVLRPADAGLQGLRLRRTCG